MLCQLYLFLEDVVFNQIVVDESLTYFNHNMKSYSILQEPQTTVVHNPADGPKVQFSGAFGTGVGEQFTNCTIVVLSK